MPTTLQRSAGDINGDGLIDAADVTLILRLAVGLPLYESASPALEAAEQAGRTYVVSVADVTGAAGSVVAVPVTISDATGLAGCELCISYNPAHLIFQSAAKGLLTQGNFNLQTRNLVGQLRLTASSSRKLSSGSGELFMLYFQVPAGSTWNQTPLSVTKLKLNGERGENLAWLNIVTASHGSITLGPTRTSRHWTLYE